MGRGAGEFAGQRAELPATPGELRAVLEEAPRGALVAVLVALAEEDAALPGRIAARVRSDPCPDADTTLAGRLERFQTERFSASRYEGCALARELDTWLEDLETGLLATDPVAAWSLVDRFLRTDGHVLGGAGDSDGAIREVYRRACALWHRAAAAHPTESTWVERVYALHADNEHGTRDAILDEVAGGLSEPALRQLAQRYEREATACADLGSARAGGAAGEEDRDRLVCAATALGQVAWALKDAALHERSVRILSPQPNALQAEHIAEQYLRFGPIEKAVDWLTRSAWDDTRVVERLTLLVRVYEALGDRDRLVDTHRQLWECSLSPERFAEYTALLSLREREVARRQAMERAQQSDDPVSAGLFLLELGEPECAEATVLRCREQLRSGFYGDLIELARGFERVGRALPEVLCYRATIEQILDEGRSAAYHRAVRYADRLAALHPHVPDYRGLPDDAAYGAQLCERYGGEREFWRLFRERAR